MNPRNRCITLAVVATVALAVLAGSADAAGTRIAPRTVPTVTTVRTFHFAAGTNPLLVTVDSKAHRAYVGTSHGVIVVNTATATARKVLGAGPRGDIAVDSRTGLAYVPTPAGSGAKPQVVVLRGTKTIKRIRLPKAVNPSSVLVDAASGLVYVTDAGSPYVTVIKGRKVLARVHVAKLSLSGAVNEADGDVYLPDIRTSSVYVLHGVKLRAKVSVGRHPNAVAVDPSRSLAYVTDTDADAVSEIKGSHHFTVHAVTMPSRPGDIAVNPTTHLAYVGFPDQTTGLTVLKGAAIEATLDIGSYPYQAGIDPVTGLVLVPTEGSNIGVITGDQLLGTVAGNPDGTFGIGFDTTNGRAVISNLDGRTVRLVQT